jgi:hypothetical protein
MLITALHGARKVDVIDNLRSILVSPTIPPQPNTQHTRPYGIYTGINIEGGTLGFPPPPDWHPPPLKFAKYCTNTYCRVLYNNF